LGRFSGSSQSALPVWTMRSSISWYSAGEPSHQRTASGRSMRTTSSIHVFNLAFVVAGDSMV